MYVVTLTERTPTHPEDNDVNVYTVRRDTFQGVLDFLDTAYLNYTLFVNVNVTYVPED